MNLAHDAFSLPKTKPKEIYARLLANEFSSVTIEDLPKINLLKEKFEQKKVQKDFNKHLTTITLSNGQKTQICKLGAEEYEHFCKTREIVRRKEFTCLWCRRHSNNQEFTGFSIPISFSITNTDNYEFFHSMYTTCTFNCALAEILSRILRFPSDQNYEKARCLIFHQFALEYPGKQLFPAPDYLLRKENGGPLEDEIYYEGTFILKEQQAYHFVPAQKLYFFSESKEDFFQ